MRSRQAHQLCELHPRAPGMASQPSGMSCLGAPVIGNVETTDWSVPIVTSGEVARLGGIEPAPP
jgi:hypothetical protein